MTNAIERKYHPSAEFRYWFFSPEGNGMMFFKSAVDRDAFAAEDIRNYLDECWGEEVEDCCAGIVTHLATKTDIQQKPTDPNELEEANWPHGVDENCDYKLMPITVQPEPAADGLDDLFTDALRITEQSLEVQIDHSEKEKP